MKFIAIPLAIAAFFLCAPVRADQPIPDFCTSTVETVQGIPFSVAHKIPMRCWALVKKDMVIIPAADVPVCKMKNRIFWNGECWLKSRIKLMHKGIKP